MPKKKHSFINKATKKKPYIPDPLEYETHCAIADYLDLIIKRPSRWHTVEVSNQQSGVAGMIKQQQLKRKGVKTGWPDIEIFWVNLYSDGWGRPELKMIFLEVKSPTGTLTERQEALHQGLREDGHIVKVVKSIKDVEVILKDLGIL